MSYRVRGVLSPEAASPLPTSKGFSGNAISFFSGVRAERWTIFLHFEMPGSLFWYYSAQSGCKWDYTRNYMSRGVINCSRGFNPSQLAPCPSLGLYATERMSTWLRICGVGPRTSGCSGWTHCGQSCHAARAPATVEQPRPHGAGPAGKPVSTARGGIVPRIGWRCAPRIWSAPKTIPGTDLWGVNRVTSHPPLARHNNHVIIRRVTSYFDVVLCPSSSQILATPLHQEVTFSYYTDLTIAMSKQFIHF